MFSRTSTSLSSGRAVTAVLGSLLLGVAGCGAGGQDGGPATTSPAQAGGGVEPAALEEFLGNDLTIAEKGDFGLDIASLVDDPSAPGGTLLRASYPEGSASRGTDGPDGGLQAYMELPSPVDVLDLTYQVRFPEGFDFVKGGKLPGLYGGTENSGGDVPDGTDGLSTRYMWRTGGEGEVYAYLPSSEEHGTSLGRGCWTFTPGDWTTMRQRVQLNTPGTSDGRITVWQDERLVLDRGGLDFRSTDQLRIDGVFFSTFFGGDDSSWASPVDQHADFAAFELAEGSAPPGAPPRPGDDSDCGTPGGS
ncbi:polysaccharide lyase [Pseudonocardia sichuanensis]